MIESRIHLANHAETAPNGLTYVNGLGWSATTSPTSPSAILVEISVPWDECNTPHKLTVSLVDSDGRPVLLGADNAGNPLQLEMSAQIEVGRPPGSAHGSSQTMYQPLGIGPLPLQPGRYEWRVRIDEDEGTGRTFTVQLQHP